MCPGEHGRGPCDWSVWELIAPGGKTIYLLARYTKAQHRIIASLVGGRTEALIRYGLRLDDASTEDSTC